MSDQDKQLKKLKRDITGKVYFSRTFDLNRKAVDEEKRTVEVAFSSEEPVERFFGLEVIDHEKMNLDRLESGAAAVLLNHDPDQQIGVVEGATVGDDRRGRAKLRIGDNSVLQKDAFNDIKDGIRSLISFGYRIDSVTEDGERDGVPVFRVGTTPFEVTFASVPADATVGVGRSIDQYMPAEQKSEHVEVKHMSEKEPQVTPAPTAPPPDLDKIRSDAEQLAKRNFESAHEAIVEMGKSFNAAQEAQEFLSSREFLDAKDPADAFQKKLLERTVKQIPPLKKSADVELSKKENKRYSLFRVIRAQGQGNNAKAQQDAAFEYEVSEEIARQAGQDPQGVFIPDGIFKRDLSAGTATDGAELVATELMAERFIDVLRNTSAAMRAGATVLDGLRGNVAIPRKTSGAAVAWIATEGGAASESDPQFDQVTLTPRTLGVFTDYTRQLFLQSSIAVEGLVRTDQTDGMALGVDLAAFHGSGAAGQPTGIENQTGINTVSHAALGAPTFAEAVQYETEVATDNALLGRLSYISGAAVQGNMKVETKDAGSGQFLLQGGEVNGYPFMFTNQITVNTMFFGNFADLLMGMWGGLDILVDPFTASTTGTVRIVSLQSMDIAVRHPESFAFGSGGV